MQNKLQDTIQGFLHQAVAEGNERGAQVAVYLDGKLEVDAFAGVTDVRTGAPVDGDSLFPVFSTTKGIFSTVIHILAERGLIDYDAPVARYWAEYGSNGKENITVRQVMAHTAGVPFVPEGITLKQSWDWDYMCTALAKLPPASEPGTKRQYHPLTFGWILGEVARRVDGRSVPQLLAEEICRPLGLKRLYCGIPDELERQTAFLEEVPDNPGVLAPPPNEVPPCAMPLPKWLNRTETRLATQPACSGIMSARDIARTYAATLPGGVNGVQLISPERLRLAMEDQPPAGGYEAGMPRRGLGYQLGSTVDETSDQATTFGHDGYGGSQGYGDTRYRLAFAITRNRFSSHQLASRIIQEIRRYLGAPVKA